MYSVKLNRDPYKQMLLNFNNELEFLIYRIQNPNNEKQKLSKYVEIII